MNIAPLDLKRYRVLKAEPNGAWLQVWYKEIKTTDGCIFGGYMADFPIFVRYEDLPLPDEDKRAIRWALRMEKRLSEAELKKKLQKSSVNDFINEVYMKAIGEDVPGVSVIAQLAVKSATAR